MARSKSKFPQGNGDLIGEFRSVPNQGVQVALFSARAQLSVFHKDGSCELFPISKKVAEALIGSGVVGWEA